MYNNLFLKMLFVQKNIFKEFLQHTTKASNIKFIIYLFKYNLFISFI